eukprot:CAMPEP_0173138790 /NCGR_PEP_ID=MMETSP1105-20130129/3892_1 /TAXON_ID=2985 /ORGANISM="Ochromonas sp., Strain BG-1" /LENGTH=653 /DNA_ID=CAMNT_0014051437 /DNA_START=615 /DNA_END=2576 /DNA_ORIENTATION=+
MTSLNFATSLLCNDIQQIKADAFSDPNQPEVNNPQQPVAENKENNDASNNNQIPALFHSFESSFTEINMALNQLNVLVDSSLSLGQAIIKCSHQDSMSGNGGGPLLSPSTGMNGNNNDLNNNDQKKNKFSEVNLIEYLRDMFHHHLPIHNANLDVEWVIETSELSRGSHVTFPDAIMLIVISTVSHMSSESNSLGFYFSFQSSDEEEFEYPQSSDEEEFEYPELMNKMIEGKLSVKILAKDEIINNNNNNGSMASASSSMKIRASNLPSFAALNTSSIDTDGAELLTKQNFLSIDKILRAINGSSKEYTEDIHKFGFVEGNTKDIKTIHEFFIPCKVLLHSQYQGKERNSGNSNNPQRVRLYRPPASNTYGLNDAGIKVTYENDDADDGLGVMTTHLYGGDESLHATNPNGPNAKATTNTVPVPVAPPQRKLRVLVVEDTIPVQKLLTRWLQNHGCEVTCANNGKIGLDYLMVQSFDIAFIDFLMPVMLGITTMKLYQEFIRQPTPENQELLENSKELLIVGMSATALESEQEEAFNYGMHFFCPKPVSLELLTIVLQAKREYNSNEEAVERICGLINLNGTDETKAPGNNTSTNQPDVSNSNPSNHATNTSNPITNNAPSANMMQVGGNNEKDNKWILFRAKKTKIHPDEPN